MADTTKNLLGTATTVAIASLGLASFSGRAVSQDQQVDVVASSTIASPRSGGDLLVELMLRTGGSHSVELLNRELRLMLSHLTFEKLAKLPALITDLRNLGLSETAESLLLATLVEVIAETDLPIDEPQIEQLAEALTAEPERALLDNPGLPEPSSIAPLRGGRGIGLYRG